MRNIDFIYMINVDERSDKFAQSLADLTPYGIIPYRFSAVNGWKLDFHTITEIGVKFDPDTMHSGAMGAVYHTKDGNLYESHEIIKERGVTYFSHCLSRGAMGIVLSHLSVLQDAYDSGYKTIWVMEDDIQTLSDPNELSDLIVKLDALCPRWDVFFTDPDIKGYNGERVPCLGASQKPNFQIQPAEYYYRRIPVGKDFVIQGARYGAHSMIVRRSGMKKILNFFKTYKVFWPYDIDYCYPPGITLHSCTRDIVSNRPDADG